MSLPNLLWALVAFTCLGPGMAQTVTQTPPAISVQEGKAVTLNCKYSTSDTSYSLFWYKQSPSGEMIFLIHQNSFNQQNTIEGRYSVNFQKASTSISLMISASQLGDSSMYFCVLREEGSGFNKLVFGIGTRLFVQPNIKNPEPALYQLTSPKSSDTSVCLFTDFDSSDPSGSNATVLEMMTMESKSYGAVTWGSKSSFNCTNSFQQSDVTLTLPSGSTCKVKDVQQSFETDKDLNLMNMSLIFLRIIFLKTVGFNLFMTLRLWSN
ncbi:T cell receptor alpha chain MC.7.G5-like [Trichosurus vulpecula]|uniref:T cell receptor alpha chain MC.7.G5-like n=1 Tax=Trichosurus vulpecula TaxID=9337 RepID=UPI00186AC5AE|nr:T cell receptor alpha chain MC.7.G5-like [Trichosurus vulpecula]